MNDRLQYWFSAKRYGWGWGLPTAWQGWVVMLAFVALLLARRVLVDACFWGSDLSRIHLDAVRRAVRHLLAQGRTSALALGQGLTCWTLPITSRFRELLRATTPWVSSLRWNDEKTQFPNSSPQRKQGPRGFATAIH